MGQDVSELRQSGGIGTVPTRPSHVDSRAPERFGTVGAIAAIVYVVVAGLVVLTVANLAAGAVGAMGVGGASSAPSVRYAIIATLGLAAGYLSGPGVTIMRRDLVRVSRRLGR